MSDEARNTDGSKDQANQAADAEPAKIAAGDAAPVAAPVDGQAADGEGGKIDPQLIGLALVLWLLAVAIFAFKWDRLRVDWYLGNIKETGDLTGRLDEASVASLAELAAGDAEVLRMVGDEAVGPLANRDEFYRSAIVKTIERVPGPVAQELLLAAASDFHGVVRANAYVSLGERLKRDASERDRALPVLLNAITGETEPMARAFAVSVAGDVGAKEALWPTIRAVRDARGAASVANAEAAEAGERAVRDMGAKTFYTLSGMTAEQLPFDPAADLATRDAQVLAWERWFVQSGGTIPPGERYEDVYPSTRAAPPAEEASPEGPKPEAQQGSQ